MVTLSARPEIIGIRRLFAWLLPRAATLWLAVMTGGFVWGVYRALEDPFNTGLDSYWAAAWLVLVAAVVGSYALIRRPVVTAFWLLTFTVVGAAMITSTGSVWAALLTGWIVALAWAWGDWLLRRLNVPSPSELEWASIA